MNRLQFKLGADPEIFLQDAAGALISAIDKIGGTKTSPKPMPIGDGFAMQEDNVALEYNVPPANSADEFSKNIKRAMDYLEAYVGEQGLRFNRLSAAEYPIMQLCDPRAGSFGCDPDFNAWMGGRPNPRPNSRRKALRTCGGHVHVGYKFKNFEEILEFIKYMDLYLGVPSVIMDQGDLRKELYGKPGAFRAKDYGVEYRVLSNFWIFSDALTNWIWTSTQQAMDAWQAAKANMKEEGQYIQQAINDNNKDIAYMLIDKHKLDLCLTH